MYSLADLKHALDWGYKLSIELLKAKNLSYLSVLAALITLIAGLVLFAIDSNINTPIDGIWSAWVTMTHVGFGDVVPISFFGRLLASALILVGLILFSLFTAIISVNLIGKNLDALGGDLKAIQQYDSTNLNRDQQLLDELTRLHARIDQLETLLARENPKHS
jgi:voltage-gated potassium channel